MDLTLTKSTEQMEVIGFMHEFSFNLISLADQLITVANQNFLQMFPLYPPCSLNHIAPHHRLKFCYPPRISYTAAS